MPTIVHARCAAQRGRVDKTQHLQHEVLVGEHHEGCAPRWFCRPLHVVVRVERRARAIIGALLHGHVAETAAVSRVGAALQQQPHHRREPAARGVEEGRLPELVGYIHLRFPAIQQHAEDGEMALVRGEVERRLLRCVGRVGEVADADELAHDLQVASVRGVVERGEPVVGVCGCGCVCVCVLCVMYVRGGANALGKMESQNRRSPCWVRTVSAIDRSEPSECVT